MLYSTDLKIYEGELSFEVKECISEIEKYFGVHKLPVLSYDAFSIVIPVNINISIPPSGAVGGIDIRETEPVLIKIFLGSYPDTTPFVMSDRKDFPKRKLSHLYACKAEEPARFCLVRGNLNEWFSNKKISDFLFVVHEWLFKAGAGLLNDDGDEFDPMRLENYSANHIYKYDTMYDVVSKNQRFVSDYPFAILFGSVRNDNATSDETTAFKSISAIPLIQLNSLLEVLKKIAVTLDVNTIPEKPIFTLLIWPEDLNVEPEYFTSLPSNYGELKKILVDRKIDIDKILALYSNNGVHKINGIIITLAIKRPKKMIGYNGDIEFINFCISGKDYTGTKMEDEASVSVLRHVEPFSSAMAQLVSGQKRDKNIVFVGAGSLGSKIIMHELRSGNKNITVVDDDTFLQHNLIRHALLDSKIGKSKSFAIIEEATSLFKFDSSSKLKAYDKKITFLSKEELASFEWLIDTTASFGVQNWISENPFLNHINIARCEMADGGKLGLLYIEGKDRNPRIDDLVNLIYYEAMEDVDIEQWRYNDSEKEETNLNIGLGCSSTTSVMSDDKISFHSAVFSQVLYNEYERKNIGNDGLIFINGIVDDGLVSTKSRNLIVKPFVVLQCGNKSGWEIRLKNDVNQKIFALTKAAKNNETGGVLVGIANYKTKTIHVLDIILAPSDSKGTPCRFKRGIKNLPEAIDRIKKKTGNMVGYVGEWHSHPMGLEELSTIDLDNIIVLQKENQKVPIPTCAIIVSNGKILPFVFE